MRFCRAALVQHREDTVDLKELYNVHQLLREWEMLFQQRRHALSPTTNPGSPKASKTFLNENKLALRNTQKERRWTWLRGSSRARTATGGNWNTNTQHSNRSFKMTCGVAWGGSLTIQRLVALGKSWNGPTSWIYSCTDLTCVGPVHPPPLALWPSAPSTSLSPCTAVG